MTYFTSDQHFGNNYLENLTKYGTKVNIENGVEPVYHLSKTGKNVIVFFIDRAVGPWAGDIFGEFPEIKKQFDGFIWFPNSLSFSTSTVTASPPLYGGYEYTQEEINRRNTELLVDKNKESHFVMPRLFSQGGFSSMLIQSSV